MLAFLADDGAHAADEGVVVGVGEEGLDVGKSAEDDVGESGGEGDGLIEVGDGEIVLAGLDHLARGSLERAIGVQLVELFLGDDDLEDAENFGLILTEKIALAETGSTSGDVVEQLGEESHFEQLVKRDESKGGK